MHLWGVISGIPGELAPQIRASFTEVAFHGRNGNLELFGNLLDGIAAEETELDDLALPLIQLGQLVKRLVHGQKIEVAFDEVVQDLVQCARFLPGAPFAGSASACVIDEYKFLRG